MWGWEEAFHCGPVESPAPGQVPGVCCFPALSHCRAANQRLAGFRPGTKKPGKKPTIAFCLTGTSSSPGRIRGGHAFSKWASGSWDDVVWVCVPAAYVPAGGGNKGKKDLCKLKKRKRYTSSKVLILLLFLLIWVCHTKTFTYLRQFVFVVYNPATRTGCVSFAPISQQCVIEWKQWLDSTLYIVRILALLLKVPVGPLVAVVVWFLSLVVCREVFSLARSHQYRRGNPRKKSQDIDKSFFCKYPK